MTYRLIAAFAALILFFASSCELLRDDDFEIVNEPLPESAATFIQDNFPDFLVRNSETEDLCDDSVVLEVELEDGPGPDIDLYFTSAGEFLFSAREVNILDIPRDIRETIAAEFPGYSLSEDDAEIYSFPDGSLQFKVELLNEDGDEVDLIISETGSIVCFEEDFNDTDDDDDDDDIVEIPDTVRTWIANEFAGFRIEGAEREDFCGDRLYYEVELEDGPSPDIDLYFNLDWEYEFSATEISVSDLPEVVIQAVEITFPAYGVSFEDEVERLDFSDGARQYLFKIVNAENDDLEVVFDDEGQLICSDDDDDEDDDSDDDDDEDDDSDDDDDDEDDDSDDDDDDEDDDSDDDDDDEDDDSDDDDDEEEGDDNSSSIPAAVRSWIETEYPSYQIVSAEREDLCDDQLYYEVELEDGSGPDLELFFSLDWEYIFVATEVSAAAIPTVITDRLADLYPGYGVSEEDEVYEFLYPNGQIEYYFEATNGEDDVEVLFSDTGQLLCSES